MGPLSPAELGDLVAKYEALLALRAARDTNPGPVAAETKTVMRQLSRAFPGCLRELDLLTRDQIEARLQAATLARSGGETAAWLAWLSRYHELLRFALAAKQGQLDQVPVSMAAFAERCAHPPAGRLVPLVFAQLALETDTSIDILRHALFPQRR